MYFEPLTLEDVLEIIAKEKPVGVIVQYGGQTPLKLCRALEAAGAPIIGTSPEAIDIAEDRERFSDLVRRLGLRQPANATARTEEQALRIGQGSGVIRWWCVPPMCWVAAPWKWSTPKKTSGPT